MKDKEVIKRFEEELIARGITSDGAISWKEASLKAKWTAGKHAGESLGATYIRDTLMKEDRGSFEGVELICNAWDLDWTYVKTGKRGATKAGFGGPFAQKDRPYTGPITLAIINIQDVLTEARNFAEAAAGLSRSEPLTACVARAVDLIRDAIEMLQQLRDAEPEEDAS